MGKLPATERTRIRRAPARAVSERAKLHQIIDEALVCHVGFMNGDYPMVIPTLGWRSGDTLYIHGSRGSRMLNVLKSGAEACITFTLLDGLVLARSAFHHSANYRSAVVLGRPHLIEDRGEKTAALKHFLEQIAPERWDTLRPVSSQEIEATDVFELQLVEASVKIRDGGPIDDDEDMQDRVWAGVIPIRRVFGPMVRSEDCADDIEEPDYASAFGERWIGVRKKNV